MSFTTIVFFIIGLILLVAGAEFFVRGTSQLAILIGVSPLVIGLTIVAYGTSSPELAVSLQSILVGNGSISLGNVIGSNIANILLILGISALVAPLIVSQQLVRLDVPIMIGVSVIVYLFSINGNISRLQGVLLFSGVIFYTVFLIVQSRRENSAIQAEYEGEFGEMPEKSPKQWALIIFFIVAGFIMLVAGSNWLVDSAIVIAEYFGISEIVIGLTIVAIGTSLPEVATSVVASIKGERDIAVGNVVGSNLFNLLMVLGAASAVSPNGMNVRPETVLIDLPVMLAVAIVCLPIFVTGYIPRWVGGVFLFYYLMYNVYLYMDAMGSDNLGFLVNTLIDFLLPLTVIAMVGMTIRQWLLRQPQGNWA